MMRLVDKALGAVFGGGLVGTWLQLRHQRAVERNRRRERAAEVLAPMLKLLGDIRPYWLDTPEPGDRELVDRYRKRWEELREPFLIQVAAHPSQDFQGLAHKVDAGMGDTIALVDWLVAEEATQSNHAKNVLKEALERHSATHGLVTELLRSV